jgi:proline iminopeptidase
VILDQRGAGRSTAEELLVANTTPHLIADIERLRIHLGIERWAVIVGFSWGTTLALAYAQAHPERVANLVLGLVGTTSESDVRWVTEDVGNIFPIEWQAFADAVPERFRRPRLVDAYADWLADPDPEVQAAAALAWCTWEDAHISLTPGHSPGLRHADPQFRLTFARLVTHYWRNAAFVPPILDRMDRLAGVGGVLIHGRHDVSSPLRTAFELHRRWPGSELVVLDGAGHGGPGFIDAVVSAIRATSTGQ